METITPEMTIADILARYPECFDVFAANGFPAKDRQELAQLAGQFLTLRTVLAAKGYNEKVFVQLLEDKIAEERSLLALRADLTAPERVDFLGYTYCPIKSIFKESFDETLAQYLEQTGDRGFQYYVPSGCTGDEDPCENIWQAESIEEFPDVVVAAGFGDFFRQQFVEKFVNKGYFRSIPYQEVNENFSAADYQDPKGWYSVYSTQPTVLLVDRKKLGNLPVPTCWNDLLNPIYKNNIIIGGSPEEVYEDILLYTYKDHGAEGLVRLAGNVKAALHGSQMAKLAGSSHSQGAGIYVIPWLFAKACPRTEDILVVWPEDGALITPMYILAKVQPKRDLQLFIDFVLGERYGQKSADNGYPVMHAAVDNRLPGNARFKWLGWDYIRSFSMEEHYEEIMKIFTAAWPCLNKNLT